MRVLIGHASPEQGQRDWEERARAASFRKPTLHIRLWRLSARSSVRVDLGSSQANDIYLKIAGLRASRGNDISWKQGGGAHWLRTKTTSPAEAVTKAQYLPIITTYVTQRSPSLPKARRMRWALRCRRNALRHVLIPSGAGAGGEVLGMGGPIPLLRRVLSLCLETKLTPSVL